MQQKISMDLLICNSEDKISLDEIVHAVSSAYESKASAELLKLILSIIQEIVIGRIQSKSPHGACLLRTGASVAERTLQQAHQNRRRRGCAARQEGEMLCVRQEFRPLASPHQCQEIPDKKQ